MDLPSLVSAHLIDPITPHPPEGKGLSGASGEIQMQSADFSGNAVGLILIPGSTGKIKRAGEAVVEMEMVLCREKKGNWELPGGSSRVFKSTPVEAKVVFAGPNPLSRNEDTEPQRVPVFPSLCRAGSS